LKAGRGAAVFRSLHLGLGAYCGELPDQRAALQFSR
jgi:hypothetical protein